LKPASRIGATAPSRACRRGGSSFPDRRFQSSSLLELDDELDELFELELLLEFELLFELELLLEFELLLELELELLFEDEFELPRDPPPSPPRSLLKELLRKRDSPSALRSLPPPKTPSKNPRTAS
jgi:hypothetical protein